jgi:hypothetical protein
MQCLEVSGAVRPLKWPLGVKWLRNSKTAYLNTQRTIFPLYKFCNSNKNLTRKSSKVIPVYATKYLLQIGVGDTICLVNNGTSEHIQWYFLKRCHVHSNVTVKESKSFPSLFPGDTSNDATGWKRPVWHARVPTSTMQHTLGENLLRPASSNSHGMGMKDSHNGRQLQKVGPGFVPWPFTSQTLVKINFCTTLAKVLLEA